MYQTVVCLFLVFLWERERLWWKQKKKQTNSVIELCLVPSAVTVIVLTFHKRNKINRCYKIQAYCSTFSSRPLDPICHIWLNLNWGRTILGKLTFFFTMVDKALYNLASLSPIHTNTGTQMKGFTVYCSKILHLASHCLFCPIECPKHINMRSKSLGIYYS